MTRGIGYIFTDEEGEIELYFSPEFNGGMDLETYGYEFLERVSRVRDARDFIREMREFNEGHFDLMEDMMYKAISNKEGCIGADGELMFDYIEQSSIHFKLFERYAEDYSFIKNATKQTLMIGCKNGIVLLKPNQTMMCELGKFMQKADGLEKLEIIEWTGEKAKCEETEIETYNVLITETRVYGITVEAESEERALEIAEEEFSYGRYDTEYEEQYSINYEI